MKTGFSIAQIVFENEKNLYCEHEIHTYLEQILHTMDECVKEGCNTEGILPGGLKVRRRAKDLVL